LVRRLEKCEKGVERLDEAEFGWARVGVSSERVGEYVKGWKWFGLWET
jgi:hypothetical protein